MITPTTETKTLCLYLASSSPRRKELLANLQIRFQVLPKAILPFGEVDEPVLPSETPDAYLYRTVMEKLSLGIQTHQAQGLPPGPILAADTMVTLGDCILGKPSSEAEAQATLQLLSGKTHMVSTAVALAYKGQSDWLVQKSTVEFATLSTQDIKRYCASQEPYDKAGAYGIQGPGQAFIRRIDGSYSGVMGLPLFETKKLLQTHDIFDSLLTAASVMLD